MTIAKVGVFNAASAGTMAYETLPAASATLPASGDQLVLTSTFTTP